MSVLSNTRMPAGATRSNARTAGLALLAMAVLAPLGLLVALPAEWFGAAAATVAVVAALDIVVAVALLPILEPGGILLARIACAARAVYAAAFLAAAGFLVAPADPDRFQAAWDAALPIFGVHLLLVGICLARAGAPRWLAGLVGLAGAGYVVDTVLVLADVDLSVGVVTFVGEVVLLVWLLGWAGRASGVESAARAQRRSGVS